jgi:hypothetical protein
MCRLPQRRTERYGWTRPSGPRTCAATSTGPDAYGTEPVAVDTDPGRVTVGTSLIKPSIDSYHPFFFLGFDLIDAEFLSHSCINDVL